MARSRDPATGSGSRGEAAERGVALIGKPANARDVVGIDRGGEFGPQVRDRHEFHRYGTVTRIVGPVLFREPPGDRALEFLFADIADIAADGVAEQMLGLDGLAPRRRRNKRKHQHGGAQVMAGRCEARIQSGGSMTSRAFAALHLKSVRPTLTLPHLHCHPIPKTDWILQ